MAVHGSIFGLSGLGKCGARSHFCKTDRGDCEGGPTTFLLRAIRGYGRHELTITHEPGHRLGDGGYGVEQRADRLAGARTSGRFQAKLSLADASVPDRIVARAIARAKAGDREAIRFLYVRYADNVYGYVRSIVGDPHEAEDVTQHVFAKLITVIARYEQRSVPFSAWMLRLAHNAAIDHLRRCRTVPAAEVYGPDERQPDSDNERGLELRSALAGLPEEQREVIVLRHFIGLTPGEIAGRLGKTEASIHGLHHRGRAALRESLARTGMRADGAGASRRMTVIGTEPVPITYLDEKDPAVRDELIEVVERVAEAGAFTLGAELEAFEEEFAAYCGSRYAVGVSSGTDALTLALKAIGVGPGDEVIVPGNTFIATAEAVSLAGATVVPIDVDAVHASDHGGARRGGDHADGRRA